jgi:hypothetical protein
MKGGFPSLKGNKRKGGKNTLNFFFRRTCKLISVKLGTVTIHHWVKGILKFVQLKDQVLFQGKTNTKMHKWMGSY